MCYVAGYCPKNGKDNCNRVRSERLRRYILVVSNICSGPDLQKFRLHWFFILLEIIFDIRRFFRNSDVDFIKVFPLFNSVFQRINDMHWSRYSLLVHALQLLMNL